jgi:hypothetical protein
MAETPTIVPVNVTGRHLFIPVLRLDKATADKVRTIPGGILCATGALMFPATSVTARRIRKMFGSNAVFSGDAAPRLIEWCDRFELAHRMRDAETLPPVPGERLPSWLHQQRGFWFGYHLPAVLLSEKVGAGKTKQFIDIMCARDRRRVLVTTTASAVDDWQIHIDKHATKPYRVLMLGRDYRTKNAVRKAEAVRRHVTENEYTVTVISHDSIWRPPLGAIIGNARGGTRNIGLLAEMDFDLFGIDEIHAAADPTGRRALFLWRLAERIPERIGMTGTIIRHKPESVFAPFRILDSGIFGPRSVDFLERYCVFNRPSDEWLRQQRERAAQGAPTLPGFENVSGANNSDPGPRFIVGYQRTEEMAALMSAITYDPGDVDLHLPIPISTTRRAFLPLAAQRVYDSLENDFVATLPDGTDVTTQNVLTQMLRLHQLAGGFIGEPVVDPDTGEIDFVNIHEVHDAKEKLLEETLRDVRPDDPVILVGRFKHDLEIFRRVCRRIGRKSVMEQSGRRKERIEWQNASGGDVLCAQIQSACEAIDLTRARYMVLYSVGYSNYQYRQMLGRMDRPGQTQQPNFIHLATAGTIDEKIYASLEKNESVAKSIIARMRAARVVKHQPTLAEIANHG